MNEVYVTATGNMVVDPEERIGQSGVPFTTFRIAVPTSKRLDGGGFEEVRTDFYRVTAFGQLARNSSYSLKKGQRVIVHGRLRVEHYKSNKDCACEGSSLEITAQSIGHDLTFGWTDYTKGLRVRQDPNDPQNDPVVRQARQQEYAAQSAPAWGAQPVATAWNNNFVEGSTDPGVFAAPGLRPVPDVSEPRPAPGTSGDATLPEAEEMFEQDGEEAALV